MFPVKGRNQSMYSITTGCLGQCPSDSHCYERSMEQHDPKPLCSAGISVKSLDQTGGGVGGGLVLGWVCGICLNYSFVFYYFKKYTNILLVWASSFDLFLGIVWFRYSINTWVLFSSVFGRLVVFWLLVLVPWFMALQWCLGGYYRSREPWTPGLSIFHCLI